MNIHSTAIIYPGAKIGKGTSIGPYSIIGPKVTLGANNQIGPHVVIEGNTSIGDENSIFQFASIGSKPQDQKHKDQDTKLIIGNKNQIREYVTLQPATTMEGITQIGDNNLFMACSHIAHDVIVGSGCWFANSACVAGHAIIGDKVIVGGLAGIHQFVRIGDLAFVAAGSMVAQDIPPFCMVQGDRAKIVKINVVGLQRVGYKTEEIQKIQKIFKHLFYYQDPLEEKIKYVQDNFKDFTPAEYMIEFIRSSQRGIMIKSASSDEE